MKKEHQKKLINYWKETAEHDYDTMLALFESKRYDASLFFGHIVLEKILKAMVAKVTGEHAPYTHDLVKLAEITNFSFSDDETKLLNEVNDFNMDARYPEWKMEFYKLCNKKYTSSYIEKIDKMYKKLCRELKLKK